MRALLDTHTLLWFVAGDTRLSAYARAIMDDPENDVLVSIASLWEVVIKVGVGKLELDMPVERFVVDQVSRRQFTVLPIELSHLVTVSTLPLHHRDPFDRLLAAQALTEDVPMLGTDSTFDAYDVQTLW
ncbi:MAG TPA: type II toxin-antitoxin system VapC family toxin [Longimicrobium sp.]|nr:type II toxin-antitoxin system VapC family toxin [Longimicrobium sp.]